MDQKRTVLDLKKQQSWKTYYQIQRGCTRVTIKKDIAQGQGMEKGQPVWLNLAEDIDGRTVIYFYVDGREWNGRAIDLDKWKRDGGGSYAERKTNKE